MALFASYDKEREREKEIKMKYMNSKKKAQFLIKEKKEKRRLEEERLDRQKRLDDIRVNKEMTATAEDNANDSNQDAAGDKRTSLDPKSEEMRKLREQQMALFASYDKEKERERTIKMKYMKPK